MLYFDHDTGASTDSKIMQLRIMCGGGAVDAYWYLVEHMHREMQPVCVGNADAMRVHCYMLCTEEETLRKWLETMFSTGLLVKTEDGEHAWSERARRNIEEYQAKREKASSAAEKRWSNASKDANAKRTQCKRNADAMPRKEKKRKDGIAIKSNTNPSASDVAAAAGAAPSEAAKSEEPRCPLCDEKMWRNRQLGKWECNICRNTYSDEKAVWS